MNLAEFVQMTLVQFIDGALGAQDDLRGRAVVFPTVRDEGRARVGSNSGVLIERVEFDVAITLSEESAVEGSAGTAGRFAGNRGVCGKAIRQFEREPNQVRCGCGAVSVE